MIRDAIFHVDQETNTVTVDIGEQTPEGSVDRIYYDPNDFVLLRAEALHRLVQAHNYRIKVLAAASERAVSLAALIGTVQRIDFHGLGLEAVFAAEEVDG